MRSKFEYVVIFLIVLQGCRMNLPDSGYEKCTQGKHYFPLYKAKVHATSDDSLDDFQNRWYSKHLNRLGEPIIYNNKDKNLNIIRYTNLGTWAYPFSIRVEKTESDVIVIYNMTNGQGGYNAGYRIKHKKKKINTEDWNAIILKMDSIGFWKMDTHDSKMIFDGAEWIVEARIDGKYHFVTRNSPDEYGSENYASLCKLIEQTFTKQK